MQCKYSVIFKRYIIIRFQVLVVYWYRKTGRRLFVFGIRIVCTIFFFYIGFYLKIKINIFNQTSCWFRILLVIFFFVLITCILVVMLSILKFWRTQFRRGSPGSVGSFFKTFLFLYVQKQSPGGSGL